MALKKAKKKIGLTTKIFIALIAGAILGIILFNLPAGSVRDDIVIDGILYVIGQGFIKLMKMLVVPLVFVLWYVEAWQSEIQKTWFSRR